MVKTPPLRVMRTNRDSQIRVARFRVLNRLSVAAAIAICLGMSLHPGLHAQSITQIDSGDSGRKVIQHIQPEYSEWLRLAHIGGIVRLNAVVQPNGTVTKVTVLGGNPILAENSVKAVLRWKFAPAASQTNEVVKLDFSTH